jgi:hypothetical protein
VNLAKTNGHGSRRRTKRISLQIPLMVTGRDEHGTVFADQVLTENVSKDGGCLIFSRDLRRMQAFKIEAQKGARFLAQVRWCMYYARRDIRRVGFQLEPTSKNEWVIGDARK